MSKLAEACEMSFNEWLATFPEEMPEAERSEKHKKWIKNLFDKMRNDRYHRFTSKAIKLILVAAILGALLLSAFVFPSSRKSIVDTFDIFSTYKITRDNNNYVNNEIIVGYIPEGYVLESSGTIGKNTLIKYRNSTGEFFTILKQSSSMKTDYDTENYTSTEHIVDGIKYIYCDGNLDVNNLIWTKNDYVYRINGNLICDEMLEIAKHVQ